MAETNNMGKLMGNSLAISLVLVALLVGLAGGVIATRLFPQDPQTAIPELDSASRSRFAPESDVTPPREEVQQPVQNEGPDLTAQQEAEAERKRLAERRRLAWDSPLTPAIADPPTMVEQANATGDETNQDGAPQNTPLSSTEGSDVQTSGQSLAQSLVQSPAQAGTGAQTSAQTGTQTNRTTGKSQSSALHLLARGSVIPTILETMIDSELPGLVRARVAEDVRDSVTGTHVLIPRGSVLVGTYGSDTRAGQQRLFVAWTDLRMADGTIHQFDRFPTLGADGASGVKGIRKTGFLKAFGAAILFDLAGNATQILTSFINPDSQVATNNNDLASLIAQATGSATSRVADQYIGSILNRGPRFTVKSGAIMNVLVEQNVQLPAIGN